MLRLTKGHSTNNCPTEWVAQTTCCLGRAATRGFSENMIQPATVKINFNIVNRRVSEGQSWLCCQRSSLAYASGYDLLSPFNASKGTSSV